MFQKILVPLDGSKAGETALPVVQELILKLRPSLKTGIVLFQTITNLTHYVIAGEVSTTVPYSEKEVAQIKKRAQEYLDKTAEQMRSKKVMNITTLVTAANNAAEEILKTADELKCDLIAMSTHGRHGLSRWAFGSAADKVLSQSQVPVLIVRVPKEAKAA